MSIVKVNPKGQLVIPIEYRKKYGIESPGQVLFTERDGYLVVLPIPNDLLDARGMLKPKKPLDISHAEYKKEELKLEGEVDEK
ncbi:MAG: AbrB/MazE/SpoVT family DNA-binding domain-containing protein [Syntrophomonadaceae bacterium]|jgi:AbrB family looped-hinge helix DNA binding protein